MVGTRFDSVVRRMDCLPSQHHCLFCRRMELYRERMDSMTSESVVFAGTWNLAVESAFRR